MNYSKPELVVLSRAVDGIQFHQGKPSNKSYDNIVVTETATAMAYEADE
jgi:hypothetical protein